MKPLYDIDKSFAENITNGPFYDGPFFERVDPDPKQWHTLFGIPVRSRIGVAACPLTATPRGIKLMSRLGYDIITYKTVASSIRSPHPHPNVGLVDSDSVDERMLFDCPEVRVESNLSSSVRPELVEGFSERNIYSEFVSFDKLRTNGTNNFLKTGQLALTNSIGNASFDVQTVCKGIQTAKENLLPGQLLIVSIFGVESKKRSLADDFAYLAACVKDAGALVVEANLSCPNVSCGVLSHNVSLVQEVTKKMVAVLGNTPLTLKVGAYKNKQLMREVLRVGARSGARGITGINTIPVRAYNKQNQSFFGQKRMVAGLSGSPIFNAACDFVRAAVAINTQEQLDLTILATGGIVTANDFQTFLDLGAHAAMSATGAMWNPHLAYNFHNMERTYGTINTHDAHRQTTV